MATNYGSGNFDTLLSDTSVRLFGREMFDIKLAGNRDEAYDYKGGNDTPPPAVHSSNNFLLHQLKREDARLARIYSFSFQNQIFDLMKPALFVVHGEGNVPDPPEIQFSATDVSTRRGIKPAITVRSGVSGQDARFTEDIRMWLYDIADFTVRLDMEAGPFERVLLEFELGGPGSFDAGATAGGAAGWTAGGAAGWTAGGAAGPRRGPRQRYRRGRWRGDDE